MNDLKALWARRRAKQNELDAQHPTGYLFLTPLDNLEANTTTGLPVELSTENAARLLLAGGHRISTATEIAEFRAHGERQRRASEAIDNRRDGKVTLQLQLAVDQPRTRKAAKDVTL